MGAGFARAGLASPPFIRTRFGCTLLWQAMPQMLNCMDAK